MILIFAGLIFIYPLELCFGGSSYGFDEFLDTANAKEIHSAFTSILGVIFFVDILLKFMTAFYDQESMIKNKIKILRNYVQYGFLSDFLAYFSVFFDMVIISENLQSNSTIVLLKKLTQCFIFLKLKDISRAWEKIEELRHFSNEGIAIFNLLKLTIAIFFFSHIMSCLWHLISYYAPFTNNLLKFSGFYNSNWYTRYLRCLFITINPGKIDPQNNLEMGFGFFALLATSGSIGFMISSIQNITRAFNKPAETQR